MLGCELWTDSIDVLLSLYREPCSPQLQSQSSAGDPRDDTMVGGQRNGKFGKFSHSGRVVGRLCIADDLFCVSSCLLGSANICRHMVNGMVARAAS